MRFFQKIKIDWFIILIVLITLILIKTNYTPNTFLSGWDSLHPEFNIGQYVKRILSVWQIHQGLGAPPAQAHAAELPRMLLIFIFKSIFPLDFVRYAYFFLMMIIGPLGLYKLLDYLFSKFQTYQNPLINKSAAFLGGLIYILNLGTMQHFIAPLEMFATKFGYLPWIFLFTIKFLDNGKKKNLVLLSILAVFSSPMAHTATLWYVFYLGLLLFLGSYFLLNRNKNIFKRGLIIAGIFLFLNLYWILPNLYYSVNYGDDVINSKIHRLFTEEAYLHNKNYGNLSDFMLLKNFLFDWRIQKFKKDGNLGFEPLLLSWHRHLGYPSISLIGKLFALFAYSGIAVSLFKKNKTLISFLPMLGLSTFFLLSNVPLISNVFEFLRSSSPFLKEILRFPFTKLSLYSIFFFAVFFGYLHLVTTSYIVHLVSKIPHNFFISLYMYFFTFLIVIFALPAFQGNFISQIVRVRIPSEYFDLFAWSQKQDDSRMLTLPVHDIFGWVYYKWDYPDMSQIYQGAGFNWFGLKQPTLNREFDRWYPYNEQNFREIYYAIYSKNQTHFEKLLNKYNIRYILFDKNFENPGGEDEKKKLFYPELSELIKNLPSLRLVSQFGKNIEVFEFLPAVSKKLSPLIIQTPNLVLPDYKANYIDEAYLQVGDYFSTSSIENYNLIQYPARNLLNQQERVNKDILKIEKNQYRVLLSSSNTLKGIFHTPNINDLESDFYADAYIKKSSEPNSRILLLKYLLPTEEGKNDNYTQEIALDTKNVDLMSLNEFVIPIPFLENDQPVYLAEPVIRSDRKIHVATYDTNRGKKIKTSFPETAPFLCSQPTGPEIFGSDITKDEVNISGKKAKVCLELPLVDIADFSEINANGLLKLSFDYLIEQGLQAQVCMFAVGINNCLSQTNLAANTPDKSFSFLVPYIKNKVNQYRVDVTLDTLNSSEIKTLSLFNFQTDFFPEVSGEDVLVNIPASISETSESLRNMKGVFPQNQININVDRLGIEKPNCGQYQPQKSNKMLTREGGFNAIEYKTVDGSICDSLPFPQLSQQSGYIVGIESKNIEGLPLKSCLQNDQTKQCILQDELSKFRQYAFDYFVLPAYNQGFGYSLIFNNFSIGDIPTVNRIKSIFIVPFPFAFIQGTHWSSNETAQQKAFILTNDQAYERNWSAYEISSDNFWSEKFPFLFGKELKEHVLVNNWANGWALPPPEAGFAPQGTLRQGSAPQGQIVVIFWPQYLEFFGFLLLLGSFFWILTRKRV